MLTLPKYEFQAQKIVGGLGFKRSFRLKDTLLEDWHFIKNDIFLHEVKTCLEHGSVIDKLRLVGPELGEYNYVRVDNDAYLVYNGKGSLITLDKAYDTATLYIRIGVNFASGQKIDYIRMTKGD